MTSTRSGRIGWSRRRRPTALAIAAGLTVAACGGGSSGETTPATASHAAGTYADAPCPSPNVPGVPQLDLGPDFTCGFLTVPENRAHPQGRTIGFAVARVKAASASPRPDPLVYLTGGPGGTGLALAPTFVKYGLNRDRDVIFVDQRGTLHADPFLGCPEVDGFMAAATGMSVQAPSTRDDDVAAVTTCRNRLADKGADLSAYDTTENAADIADLRTALGVDQWNVYGVSASSNLALQLLRDHPEGIRSVVLDSLVPPQAVLMNQFWPSAAEGYRALFDACAAQSACAAAYPHLADEFTATVNRLARQPLSVDLPGSAGQPPRHVVIDGYTLANLVVALSLSPGTYADLPATIHAIAGGDGTAAATALLGTLTPPGLVGYGLTYGTFCREHAAFTDTATVLATAKTALPDFPDEVLSLPPQVPRIFDECSIWDVGRAPASVHDPTHSDVPALLMAGTFDAVTPPSQADEAATTLPRSTVVRFPGLGHDVLGVSDCARTVMLDFLDHPDGYDSGCVGSVVVPTFTTR
ncbi:alpha/beta hydrolase [Rhodococcus spelaei]|uniref:Alpha/beta hydrolase n=1 Tax=Rhodococcus spelaei TaxID=2546320 RepID=A0A541BAD4_9NOCA|nr:alpha/beta fold hydrolase [Rhodococcus spelaei]TQF69287.1 alpha/beta hydrolase [Rhodococcus spelaei]